jgi:hypothetical protein
LLGGLGKGVAAAGEAYTKGTGRLIDDEMTKRREERLLALQNKYSMDRAQFDVDNRAPTYQTDADGVVHAITGGTASPVTTGEGGMLTTGGKENAPHTVKGFSKDGRDQLYHWQGGEFVPVGGAKAGHGAGGANSPADVVMAEIYQKDHGGDLSGWLDHVRSGRYSPEQLAMDYANKRLKDQAGAFLQPGDPGYLTREEAVEEGYAMAAKLREMRMPKIPGANGTAKPDPDPGAGQQGGGVQGGDPGAFDVNEVYAEAYDIIKKGADRDAVLARLEANGIPTSPLMDALGASKADGNANQGLLQQGVEQNTAPPKGLSSHESKLMRQQYQQFTKEADRMSPQAAKSALERLDSIEQAGALPPTENYRLRQLRTKLTNIANQ